MDKSITITLLRLYNNEHTEAETVKHRTILLSYCFRGGGAIYSEPCFRGSRVPGLWRYGVCTIFSIYTLKWFFSVRAKAQKHPHAPRFITFFTPDRIAKWESLWNPIHFQKTRKNSATVQKSQAAGSRRGFQGFGGFVALSGVPKRQKTGFSGVPGVPGSTHFGGLEHPLNL